MLADSSPEALRYLVDQCLGNEERLTAWERSFIENVSDQLERNSSLTENQIEKLEEIYQKVP